MNGKFEGLGSIARSISPRPLQKDLAVSEADHGKISGLLGHRLGRVTHATQQQRSFLLGLFARFINWCKQQFASFKANLAKVRSFSNLDQRTYNDLISARINWHQVPGHHTSSMNAATKEATKARLSGIRAGLAPMLARRDLTTAMKAKQAELKTMYADLVLSQFKEEFDQVLLQHDITLARSMFQTLVTKYRGDHLGFKGGVADPITEALMDFNSAIAGRQGAKTMEEVRKVAPELMQRLTTAITGDTQANLTDPFVILGLDRSEGHAYYYDDKDIENAYVKQKAAIESEFQAGNLTEAEAKALLQILDFAHVEVANPYEKENWLYFFEDKTFEDAPIAQFDQLIQGIQAEKPELSAEELNEAKKTLGEVRALLDDPSDSHFADLRSVDVRVREILSHKGLAPEVRNDAITLLRRLYTAVVLGQLNADEKALNDAASMLETVPLATEGGRLNLEIALEDLRDALAGSADRSSLQTQVNAILDGLEQQGYGDQSVAVRFLTDLSGALQGQGAMTLEQALNDLDLLTNRLPHDLGVLRENLNVFFHNSAAMPARNLQSRIETMYNYIRDHGSQLSNQQELLQFLHDLPAVLVSPRDLDPLLQIPPADKPKLSDEEVEAARKTLDEAFHLLENQPSSRSLTDLSAAEVNVREILSHKGLDRELRDDAVARLRRLHIATVLAQFDHLNQTVQADMPDLLAADARNLEAANLLSEARTLIFNQPPIENNGLIRSHLSNIKRTLASVRETLTHTDLPKELIREAVQVRNALIEQFNLFSEHLRNNPLTERAVFQYHTLWAEAGEHLFAQLRAENPDAAPNMARFESFLRNHRQELSAHNDTRQLSPAEIDGLFDQHNERDFLLAQFQTFLRGNPGIQNAEHLKARLNRAFLDVQNGTPDRPWAPIQAHLPMAYADGRPGAIEVTQTPTNQGFSALSTAEHSHSINTWDYQARDEQGREVISGIRHGINNAFRLDSAYLETLTDTELATMVNDLLMPDRNLSFQPDLTALKAECHNDPSEIATKIRTDKKFRARAADLMRKEASFNRSCDWVRAALVNHIERHPELQAQLAAGGPIDLSILEMSLLTPDIFRAKFSSGGGNERKLLEEQAAAYREALTYFSNHDHKITVQGQDGSHEVSLNLQIVNFNFGVNKGALTYGLAQSYQEETFNESAIRELDGRKNAVLEQLNAQISATPRDQIEARNALIIRRNLIIAVSNQVSDLYASYRESVTTGVEPLRLTIRIGYLAYLLDMIPSHHCKDGTDRTSQHLAELTNLAALTSHDAFLNQVSVPVPDRPSDQNLTRIVLGMGNDQVQKHSFGLSGYKSVLGASKARVEAAGHTGASRRQVGLSEYRPHGF